MSTKKWCKELLIHKDYPRHVVEHTLRKNMLELFDVFLDNTKENAYYTLHYNLNRNYDKEDVLPEYKDFYVYTLCLEIYLESNYKEIIVFPKYKQIDDIEADRILFAKQKEIRSIERKLNKIRKTRLYKILKFLRFF